jgi:outer membrane protein OmpA-like peptidoglycan-associated protein
MSTKLERIINYLEDSGVSRNRISFVKSEEADKEKTEFLLTSKETITSTVVKELNDFFTGNFTYFEKLSPTKLRMVADEKLMINDKHLLGEKITNFLDIIIKVLKNDPAALLEIRKFSKVPSKKWYEKNWVMALLSVFTPVLGAISIFLNRFIGAKKKWMYGLPVLLWAVISHFGLMKLSKAGVQFPKGLLGFLTGGIPIIGGAMIFLNKYINSIKKWIFGLLTLGLGVFSFNNLKHPDILSGTEIPNISVKSIKTPDVKGIEKTLETKTLDIFTGLETNLKDVISSKKLIINKVSDREIKLTAHNSMTFSTNDSTVNPEFKEVLKNISQILKEHPEYKVKIEGYTDNTGTDKINNRLSKERADHVAAYLKEEGTVADRITSVGLGSKNPVATNETEEGRKENRRIEMTIFTD